MSLLSKLKAGKLNHKDICYPGTDRQIRLVLLSEQDTLDSALAADRLFKKEDVAVAFHNINAFENEKSTQMLYRSCRNIETGDKIADSITDFRQLLTNEERNVLISEYNLLAAECNPDPVEMPAEEFDALVETIKKNPSQTIGSISSLKTLKRLSLFLVEVLLNSQQASGSTSS